MSDEDDERAMIEELAGAYRPTSPREIRYHPVFYDLGEEGRAAAHQAALRSRRVEAALDPQALSTTVRAVLARLDASTIE